jgi:hypothetical protein
LVAVALLESLGLGLGRAQSFFFPDVMLVGLLASVQRWP